MRRPASLTVLWQHAVPRAWLWGVAVLGPLVALLIWASPISPLALNQGDAALGRGDPQSAVNSYDRVAAFHPWRGVRQEALYRSAKVWLFDLDHPEAALARLDRLARSGPDAARLGHVFERIGHLRMHHFQEPRAAARAFERAHRADPTSDEAPGRLALAAQAWATDERYDDALELWEELAVHDDWKARSLVARGEIKLTLAKVQDALELFERAIEVTDDRDLQVVARLGAASCLERLGSLDEALAELDEADVPDDVWHTRVEGLRARREANSGTW